MKCWLLVFLIISATLTAQVPQTTIDSTIIKSSVPFKYTALIVPAGLITYGIIGLESHTLKDINLNT